MCDKCIPVQDKLHKFLDELEREHPGTTVEFHGKDMPVPPSHHVMAALTFEYRQRMEEYQMVAMLLNSDDAAVA